ncbi:MAG TPA: type 1 glutamine amidotransferase domain-containing protein [Jatrophihabitans sp.]|nr:type 1 glutamine amidotransferase domain-containing protein [Jatrophihabitans sp.]
MAAELAGKRIAFLVANVGVEQVELTSPWQAVEQAGGEPVLLAPKQEPVQAVNGDIEPGDTFDPSGAVGDVSPDDYDALVLPGGVANPDKLRIVPEAVEFVRSIARAGKPIASICHGPWSLVEADLVRGKTLTSWPSLQTDVRNAGGEWRDVEVFSCSAQGFTLVTSRKPDDLEAFDKALVEAFAG